MEDENTSWIAPKGVKLPDFIIAGAMKSGTSTIHAVLNQHPDVYIPQGELHFFDMDNIVQHPDFNRFQDKQWQYHDVSQDPEYYWHWYANKFSLKEEGQLVGEDSTSYLASECALKRISQQQKAIKLVIILRHPTARVYSHYWHMVKSGRAIYSFEDTLKYLPHSLLDRSAYYRQLKTLYSYFPEAQIKVVLFEDFIADRKKLLRDLCEFLLLDYRKIPPIAFDLHENKAKIPLFVTLDLIKTRLFRHLTTNHYQYHFSPHSNTKKREKMNLHVFVQKCYRVINPLIEKKTPPINQATKLWLDDYFYRELNGINELLKRDVMTVWFDKKGFK